MKDLTLGNLIGKISGTYGKEKFIQDKAHHTSVKRKHLLAGDTLDPQYSLMAYSSKGSPIKRRSKCFIKNSKLMEFMG